MATSHPLIAIARNDIQQLVLPSFPMEVNDNTFVAVYCFVKNFVGVSSCTSAVIDAKIEQAMNQVKNHLTYILQEEVESLKDHIDVLLNRVKQLEMENNLLKSNPKILSPQLLTATPNSDFDSDLQTEDMEVAAITANGNFCTGF